MMLTIHLHGVLSRLAGSERITLELTRPATMDEVLQRLGERWPAMAAELRRTACAVGDQLVARTEQVATGAELNLLPPVSGG